MPHRVPIVLVLIGHLLFATAYNIGNPLGEAPDEADHWAYIVYLARERRLPQGPRVTQSKHPPFYHATSALVASLSDPTFAFLRANPDVQIFPSANWSPNFFIHTTREDWPWRNGPLSFHLVRLWSTLLSTATVLAGYHLFRTIAPSSPGLVLAATAMLAFLPEVVFIGSSINNDNAAALFGTLSLWGALTIYNDGRLRAGWWLPFALGLGFLAKVSTSALWPAVALAILLPGAAKRPLGQRFRNSVITFSAALLMAMPWMWRNWQLYGDPTGMSLIRQTVDLRSTPWTWSDTQWLIQGWLTSFWGKFGGAGHIPYPGWVYAIGLGAVVLALFGYLRLLTVHPCPVAVPVLLILGLAAGSVCFAIWRYSLIALGTDQARLLFPALGPLVFLIVLGLYGVLPRASRLPTSLAGSGLLLALALYGLFGVIRPAFAAPRPPSAVELQALATHPAIRFDGIMLIGWRVGEQTRLDWQGTPSVDEDYRTIFRVTAIDGSLVWEKKRSPGYGRHSTDHWSENTIVRDEYTIEWPPWSGSGTYHVELAVQPFGGDPVQATTNDGPAPDFAYPYLYLGAIER